MNVDSNDAPLDFILDDCIINQFPYNFCLLTKWMIHQQIQQPTDCCSVLNCELELVLSVFHRILKREELEVWKWIKINIYDNIASQVSELWRSLKQSSRNTSSIFLVNNLVKAIETKFSFLDQLRALRNILKRPAGNFHLAEVSSLNNLQKIKGFRDFLCIYLEFFIKRLTSTASETISFDCAFKWHFSSHELYVMCTQSMWFDIKIPWNRAHLELFTHLTRREIVFFNWIKIKGFKWETNDIKAVINAKRWARTARLSLCNVFLSLPSTLEANFVSKLNSPLFLEFFSSRFSSVSGKFSFHADWI